jgi:DNA-binding NarL/FixJ family response regulator
MQAMVRREDMKIQVLLVDGRKLFREGLGVLLEKHADIKVAGEADDAAAAPKLVKALSPQVVILNATLNVRSVARSIESITKAGARVIVLTFQPDAAFIRDVLQAGASGCLTRESASAELVTAIRTVVAQRTYLSPSIADAVVEGYVLPHGRRKAPKNLSAREREILQRIADGQTTKTIASALGVSVKTIETYRRRLMEKLGLHSVAGLTKYAVRAGLTSLELQA